MNDEELEPEEVFIKVKRERLSDTDEAFIYKRDNYKCRYCGNKFPPFHLDHVYPVSLGGETSIANMVVACKKCNLEKNNKIGVWPRPVGYFDLQKKLLTRVAWLHAISVIGATTFLALAQIYKQEFFIIPTIFFVGINLCVLFFTNLALSRR